MLKKKYFGKMIGFSLSLILTCSFQAFASENVNHKESSQYKKVLMSEASAKVIQKNTLSVKSGWGGGTWMNSNGSWWYQYDNAGYATNGWHYIGGQWYFFDTGGWMQTGWLNLGGTWYYLSGSGAMVSGWQSIGGSWYYFDGSGAMVVGWLNLGGTWYYLSGSGAMATGWLDLNGTWYYLYSNGAMATGTITESGKTYYLDSSGALRSSNSTTANISLWGASLLCSDNYLNYSGSSRYMSQFVAGVNTWNAYKPGVIRPTPAGVKTDVTISDYNEVCQTAAYTSTRGVIRFNVYHMDTYKPINRLNVCIHEIGHALGLDHNQKGDIMYAYVTDVVTLSENDKRSYDAAYNTY